MIRSRLKIFRGTDGRVLPRPGDVISPAGCFTRRSLPPIYIHGTGLLHLPTKQTPRANQKTELKPRAITRFDQKQRENKHKKKEMELRATTLFKRPPMILGGPPGDSRARAMQVF